MADWSDTPPTVAGLYWLKNRFADEAIVGENDGSHWKIRGGIWHPIYVAKSYQFGSLIPSNAEITTLNRALTEYKVAANALSLLVDKQAAQIAKLTAERDAAEAELEAATQRILDQEVA